MFKKIILVTALLIFLLQGLGPELLSQVKGLSNYELQNMMQENSLGKMSTDKLLTGESVPVGNIVNPDYYYIGPGDVLTIQNLSTLEPPQSVVVSPENTVIIPRVGQANLSGMTLTQARLAILEGIKSKNSNAIAFVVLQKPRNVVITLSGNTDYPGTYTLPASYSISTAIKVAGQLNKESSTLETRPRNDQIDKEQIRIKQENYSEQGLSLITSYSRRNITVIHNNGSSDNADLEKAQVLSDPQFDPYIREGDEIIIPFESKDQPFISISGAVTRPAIAAYKPGDKASLLLKLGYSLKDDADPDNIYLVNPGSGDRIKLNVDREGNLTGGDFDIQPGSAIIAGQKKIQSDKTQGVIAVSGNVRSPGAYIITPRVTKLKEAIDLAGGFTQEAYLPLAYVLRRDKKDIRNINTVSSFYENFQYSDLTMQDTSRFIMDIKLRRPYVSCDFVSAFEKNSEVDNVLLQDGDIVVVPSNPNTVYVFGQVNNPGFINFEGGRNLDWYISKAGGIAEGGISSRARIIRGRTRTWVEGGEDVYVYAGDEIYVPRTPDDPPGTEFQKYALILSVGGLVLSAMINLLFYFKK